MSNDLKDYQQLTMNWRRSIKLNRRRSFFVMLTYILIYLALGLLIDCYIYLGHYPQAPISVIFKALITFQLTPHATLITGGVALFSLLVTISMSNRLMLLGTEYREITPETAANEKERQLYNVIEEMKVASGLTFMPKVYVIEANYMNAFASGYSEKSAMVVVTHALLDILDRSELQAVMAHELSHIRHLDIKLTLMASVLSNLILIVLDLLFFSVVFGGGQRQNGERNQLFIVILLLRYLLPLITVILMLFLSRTREYMADAGAVELMRDNEPMARALLKIAKDHEQNKEALAREYQSTRHESVRQQAYIFDPKTAGISLRQSMSEIFSTHPSTKNRLEAIGFKFKGE